MVALVVALQLAALYVPPLQGTFLRLVPLSPADLLLSVGLGFTLLLALEVEKGLARRRTRTRRASAPT